MLKIQNPVTISATRKRQADDGIFSWKRIPRSGLNTLARGVRKLQTASGQVSGLCIVTSEATIFTVARPRGILTRFPFLPAQRGTPKTHLKELTFD